MSVSPDKIAGEVADRALTPDREKDPGSEYLDTQGRLLGEMLNSNFIPTLIELGASNEQAIKSLHRIGTVGTKAYEDVGRSDELVGGEYRNHEVSIGEFVPPKNNDVAVLMEKFGQRLETLLYEATATSIDHVAAWAYVMLIAIHPFPDGNGRTGRSLIEFVRTTFEKSRGQSLPKLKLDSDEHNKNQVALKIVDLIKQLGLEPTSQHAPTSMEAYKLALQAGKPEVYFSAVAEQISIHLEEKFTAIDLQFDKRFEGIVRLLREPIDKAKTKPLIQDYASAVTEDVTARLGLST